MARPCTQAHGHVEAAILDGVLNLDDGYRRVPGDYVPHSEPQLLLLFGGLYRSVRVWIKARTFIYTTALRERRENDVRRVCKS